MLARATPGNRQGGGRRTLACQLSQSLRENSRSRRVAVGLAPEIACQPPKLQDSVSAVHITVARKFREGEVASSIPSSTKKRLTTEGAPSARRRFRLMPTPPRLRFFASQGITSPAIWISTATATSKRWYARRLSTDSPRFLQGGFHKAPLRLRRWTPSASPPKWSPLGSTKPGLILG